MLHGNTGFQTDIYILFAGINAELIREFILQISLNHAYSKGLMILVFHYILRKPRHNIRTDGLIKLMQAKAVDKFILYDILRLEITLEELEPVSPASWFSCTTSWSQVPRPHCWGC